MDITLTQIQISVTLRNHVENYKMWNTTFAKDFLLSKILFYKTECVRYIVLFDDHLNSVVLSYGRDKS